MADEYQSVTIETDPTVLAQDALTYLQTVIPGFEAPPGSLVGWLIEALAPMASDLRDVAADMPDAAFRRWGQLVGVSPIEATAATAYSTWTMVDNAGYTIAAGTVVGLRDASDTLIGFRTAEEITIPAGATSTTSVLLVASDPGASGSGLTGTPELIDALNFVDSIVLVGQTTGGEDAESDEEYLNRLSAKLQLLSPAPILPADFAALAADAVGVERALALDLLVPGVNEVQSVDITGSPTGGTSAWTWNGQTTAGIAWNATAAAVKTALDALSNLNVDDTKVTAGGPLPDWDVVIEFTGLVGNADQPQITVNTAGLTGGTPGAVVSTLRPGVADQTNVERAVAVALIDELGEAVSYQALADIDALLQSLREANFVVSVIDPTYTTIQVTFSATALRDHVAATVETAAEAAVSAFLSPANWGTGVPGPSWGESLAVRYLEIAEVINRVDGVHYIDALTIGVEGGAMGSSNLVLSGKAPLPRPGTIAGTVTAAA